MQVLGRCTSPPSECVCPQECFCGMDDGGLTRPVLLQAPLVDRLPATPAVLPSAVPPGEPDV